MMKYIAVLLVCCPLICHAWDLDFKVMDDDSGPLFNQIEEDDVEHVRFGYQLDWGNNGFNLFASQMNAYEEGHPSNGITGYGAEFVIRF